MNFIKEDNRIYAKNETGSILALISFPSIREQTVCIDHTFVDDSLRGQGIANQLMEKVVQSLTSSNCKAKATCSYARNWIEKHPEYNHLFIK